MEAVGEAGVDGGGRSREVSKNIEGGEVGLGVFFGGWTAIYGPRAGGIANRVKGGESALGRVDSWATRCKELWTSCGGEDLPLN